ncbi:MAG: 50S ribosomal protein L6 [Candidatus Omnitrophota bacterium]|jgi:large subunit ribosomal protein L6
MSRIGRKPIAVPKEVKVEIQGQLVKVTGPKGCLELKMAGTIFVEQKEGQLLLCRKNETKPEKSLHGLYRALIVNNIKGVLEGYSKELEIIGMGFKAQVQGNKLNMNLGFSHPVNIAIPEGIKVEAPKPTSLIIKGIDKEQVGKLASEIRAVYPPEPYKGKGIRYVGEQVKKKLGKAQAGSK